VSAKGDIRFAGENTEKVSDGEGSVRRRKESHGASADAGERASHILIEIKQGIRQGLRGDATKYGIQ